MAKLKLWTMVVTARRDADTAKGDPPGFCGVRQFNSTLCYGFFPEDAEAWGVERGREIMPESEGWQEHAAHLNELPLEDAARILKMIDLGEFDVEYDDPARAQIPTFTVTRERVM